MILLYEVTKIVKCRETESRMVVARGWGEGEMQSHCSVGLWFQFCKIKRVLETGCTTA